MNLQVNALLAPGMKHAVSFTLAQGEMNMLYGASGTGKSVLLKALADLLPHQGEVRLDATPQQQIPPPQWRRQVMYFAAETAWWQETVEAHFESQPSAGQLQSIGLDSEYLQRSVNTLSSGEKQRLALLRGLSYQPKVLLLDEITANLDPESTLQVEHLVTQYVQGGASALWVSHDPAQRERLVGRHHNWSIEELYTETA
jgi:ABC-type iron transport system FetAB ATPase subunit